MKNDLVVLGYANASPFPYHAWTPLAILSLGAYLEKHGIDVEYYDERIHKKDHFRDLVKRKPLLVGLSTMTCFQIKNTLEVDIFAYLNQSSDRATSLNGYLNTWKILNMVDRLCSLDTDEKLKVIIG